MQLQLFKMSPSPPVFLLALVIASATSRVITEDLKTHETGSNPVKDCVHDEAEDIRPTPLLPYYISFASVFSLYEVLGRMHHKNRMESTTPRSRDCRNVEEEERVAETVETSFFDRRVAREVVEQLTPQDSDKESVDAEAPRIRLITMDDHNSHRNLEEDLFPVFRSKMPVNPVQERDTNTEDIERVTPDVKITKMTHTPSLFEKTAQYLIRLQKVWKRLPTIPREIGPEIYDDFILEEEEVATSHSNSPVKREVEEDVPIEADSDTIPLQLYVLQEAIEVGGDNKTDTRIHCRKHIWKQLMRELRQRQAPST